MPINISAFSRFFKLESAGGILLIISALLAIILANSPLDKLYHLFLSTPVEIKVGHLELAKPLSLWINDGLMAVFFFLVGLELKRELLDGALSDFSNVILPAVGAIGGMLVPALVYYLFNAKNPVALQGWAIPTATDIAFALGIVALLGARVPISIKLFLTALAIFDDIGAVIIIAVFYTSKISSTALIVVAVCVCILAIINRLNVVSKSPYILIGLIMWWATVKSGVHATLAGVILAMFIPLHTKDDSNYSPLRSLEHDLHSVVAFFVLPVFAFANAGISFDGVGVEQLSDSVTLGVVFGLFLGKQLGIFAVCYLFIKLGFTRLPEGMDWLSLYGTAILCGVGFTMSLFIGSLAFEETGVTRELDERLGVIVGSLLSGCLGYGVLRRSLRKL